MSIEQGLLLWGSRLYIPPVLCNELLSKIHEGNQSIFKCRALAISSVWWPGLNEEVGAFVTSCIVCTRLCHSHTEPMISSDLPKYPWQKICMWYISIRSASNRLLFQIYQISFTGTWHHLQKRDQSSKIYLRPSRDTRRAVLRQRATVFVIQMSWVCKNVWVSSFYQ